MADDAITGALGLQQPGASGSRSVGVPVLVKYPNAPGVKGEAEEDWER
jgi:hypothetical protein